MNEERLRSLLYSAFPKPEGDKPSRDLWPSIVRRIEAPTAWSWIDTSVAVGVATGVAITLAILPKALLLLAYHSSWGGACYHIYICLLIFRLLFCPPRF